MNSVLVLISAVLTSILSVRFDLFESFHDFSRAHESWELDEILVVAANLVLGLLAILWVNRRSLKQAVAVAEASNKAKGQFLSIVSHELRTPLTSIKGSLDLLEGRVDADLTSGQLKLVAIASKNTNEMVRLVEDLLDFQQIAAGELTLDMQLADVAALTKRSVDSFNSFAPEKGLQFFYTGTYDPVFLKLDSQRINQVLANLMSNAAKFSSDGGIVVASVSKISGLIRVTVRDTGCGIREQDREFVFRDFSQADASDTRRYGGIGLGLAISKYIIEQHRGHMDFTSTDGEGSEFYFELPIDVDESRTQLRKQPKYGTRLFRYFGT